MSEYLGDVLGEDDLAYLDRESESLFVQSADSGFKVLSCSRCWCVPMVFLVSGVPRIR